MNHVIVCERCGAGGDVGPLFRVGPKGHEATYRHKKCLEQAGPTAPMPTNRHGARPRLLVAHAKLPKLTDIHA